MMYKGYTVFQIRKLENVYVLNQPEKPLNEQFNVRVMVLKVVVDAKH